VRLGNYPVWSAIPILLLGGTIFSNSAYGSLVFSGVASGKGAGIGASNVVLGVQANPTEQGCVAWNGTASAVGSGACPDQFQTLNAANTNIFLSPDITGGNEKKGSSFTQAVTVAGSGVLTGSSLAVIVNVTKPASGAVTISNVSLTIFDPNGVVLFNSGNMTGVPFVISNSLGGGGTLGFALQLDPTEAALANQFICTSAPGCSASNANNHFGLAAFLSGTSGSHDEFSIADTANVAITTPEPWTLMTIGGGLLFLGLLPRSRRARGTA